ncbi:MAG: sulfatase [Segetibacter sp.]|nr:sulfatase [Segetibacter sp.]
MTKYVIRILVLLFMFIPNAKAQGLIGKPNIIYIIADDVSYDDFGCYGNKDVRTPNIDRIAKEGIRFTNAYLTSSSCSPSRTSIISGRYPHNTGSAELHTPLPVEQIPFPLLLKNAGYYTVQAGKSHFGTPALRAFDNAYEGKEGGTGAEERWVKCLQERPKDKPIFAWFAALDAHRIWQADKFGTPHDPKNIQVPPYLADTDATRRDIASYYNEISRFDYYIGEVEKELKKQGVLDNTIIIIMADNGRPFPRCKTRLYDSGIRTPFIVKWAKGVVAGSVCNSLLSAVDIAPTLAELAGLKPPKEFQGKSFSKLFKNPQQEFRQYVYAEHNWHDYEAHERMIRSKNFLYIVNSRPNVPNHGPADANSSPSFNDLIKIRDSGKLSSAQQEIFMLPRPYEELYDCATDTMQLLNIASVPSRQETLRTLKEALQYWRTETKDNTPEKITGDWFNRETGASLDKSKNVRGEMPGVRSGGTTVVNEHPLGFN